MIMNVATLTYSLIIIKYGYTVHTEYGKCDKVSASVSITEILLYLFESICVANWRQK